ncbi:hydroxylase, partial [Streptomyces zinciresistens K42]
HMSWTFEEMTAYASRGTRVVPGDVLGSGTCGNGGCLAELAEALPDLTGPQDLTVEELQVMRQTAWAEFMHGDTALVTSAVEAFGRTTAESMYGTDLVQRALRLTGHSALMSLGRR